MWKQETLVFKTEGKSNFRIPSLVADGKGTLYAFCNDRKRTVDDAAAEVDLVFSRKRPGKGWEPPRPLVSVPGWACSMGSAVYDAVTDAVMCGGERIPVQREEFREYTPGELAEIEERADRLAREAGVPRGQFLLSTRDGGETWQDRPLQISPAVFELGDGRRAFLGGSCHGAAHGIQLRRGEHAGRLLCPSRTQTGGYHDWEGLRKNGYNNAVFSDDHGLTWHASGPVQPATGEGALIENRDGSVTYNSRAYHGDRKRYLATSLDGGETWGDFRTDGFLLEEKNIGCNASFLRVEREDLRDAGLLPEGADGVTLFANPRSETRDHMTLCVSFDSGVTWRAARTVYEGPCAYSSLDFSPAGQTFCLLYELGDRGPYDRGIAAAEFDLEWLLA